MNYWAMAFKMAQTDFNLGADIMNITGKYLSSKTKQARLEAEARNFGRQAQSELRLAGSAQTQGEQEREMRLIQLGQDRGRINAEAAGSGMDVTSRTVAKTEKDTIRSAYNDVAAIARNERIEAQSHIDRWGSALSERLWTRYSARVEARNRKAELWSGILTAAANWHGGMVDSFAAMMGGSGGVGASMIGG